MYFVVTLYAVLCAMCSAAVSLLTHSVPAGSFSASPRGWPLHVAPSPPNAWQVRCGHCSKRLGVGVWGDWRSVGVCGSLRFCWSIEQLNRRGRAGFVCVAASAAPCHHR